MTRDAAERSFGSFFGNVAAAILVMLMLEVLVARMAWGAAMVAKSAKMDRLSEGISGTASMIMSEEERSEMEVEGTSRERASSASERVRRDLDTDLESRLSANWSPLSRDFCEESTTVTGILAT